MTKRQTGGTGKAAGISDESGFRSPSLAQMEKLIDRIKFVGALRDQKTGAFLIGSNQDIMYQHVLAESVGASPSEAPTRGFAGASANFPAGGFPVEPRIEFEGDQSENDHQVQSNRIHLAITSVLEELGTSSPIDMVASIPSVSPETRASLLSRAADAASLPSTLLDRFEDEVTAIAIETLGGEAGLGRAILNEHSLVEALMTGFPVQTLSSLRKHGIPQAALEQIVAPRRTLMRRKAEGQRLTRSESDAVWRLAHVFAMASKVLNGPKTGLAWLARPKPGFANLTPFDLLETSTGTKAVARLLLHLEWGETA
jgi:putative toxin-antitoxin system antitoxin component (TIGR02293 family)